MQEHEVIFKHWFGDIVYIITDPEQSQRIIVEMIVKPPGIVLYGVQGGTENSMHYDFELTCDVDIIKRTNN